MSDQSDILSDYSRKKYESFWTGAHLQIHHERESYLVRTMLRPVDGWLLETGCGYGRIYEEYRSRSNRVVVLDHSVENLRRFRETYPDAPVRFVAGDIRRLPFRPSSFAGALSIRVIQNLPDPEQPIAEISRVLLPQSQFLISYFNRRSLLRLLRYGPRCLKETHVKEHDASFGMMCGTHPAFFLRLVQRHSLHPLKQRGAGFAYQLANAFPILARLIENRPFIRSLSASFGNAADAMLGPLGLALWQFVDLEKGGAATVPQIPVMDTPDFPDLLQCPSCSGQRLSVHSNAVICDACGRTYPFADGVYDFRTPAGRA